MLFRDSLIFFLFFAMSAVANSAHAEVVIIVSAKSSVTSLTAEQTAKIFLGKVVNFPNDQPAFPIDQPEGSPIRDEFYSKVAHKNSSQLTAYWQRSSLRAKVVHTTAFKQCSRQKAVANNPNAIGYIDISAVNHTVRVVLTP